MGAPPAGLPDALVANLALDAVIAESDRDWLRLEDLAPVGARRFG